jgi:hypothetical protein
MSWLTEEQEKTLTYYLKAVTALCTARNINEDYKIENEEDIGTYNIKSILSQILENQAYILCHISNVPVTKMERSVVIEDGVFVINHKKGAE